MNDGNNEGGSAVFFFLAGAIIGAGLGLLFAPRSGKETRQQLADMAQRAQIKASEAASRFGDRVQSAAEDLKNSARSSSLG